MARTGVKNMRSFCLPFLICVLLAVLAGCGGKKGAVRLGDKYQQDYEEIVDEPYIPRDDGVPLTSAELQAFKAKGLLDRELSQEDSQIVELHFKYFVHDRRGTFERFLARTSRYLPYIAKVFKERGIPEEVAYLAMVESGGNPNAISPAGAAGLWQFMPRTGTAYGLSQNNWVDERRDPFKATHAAADYLLKLHGDFGNWLLAIAAYNAGEGKIGRAVEGTGADDFFELCRKNGMLDNRRRLKEETQQYVPRLLAICKIMRNPKQLGFKPPSKDDEWELTAIGVPPGTNLTGLARTLGLSWEEFSAMNPAFRRTASPPTVATVAYVPPEIQFRSQFWLASPEARIYADWREYTVRRGDTLAGIGKKHRVSVAELRDANNISSLPRPGAVILIPGTTLAGDPVRPALPERTGGSLGTYTVKAGDTLNTLAQRWGTSVKAIESANKISSRKRIVVGQKIQIPAGSKRPPAGIAQAAAKQPKTEYKGGDIYKVQPGDTLLTIARICSTTVDDLCDINGISKKTMLKIGQNLRIPDKAGAKRSKGGQPKVEQQAAKGGQAQAKRQARKVKVQAGDTLYSLARKHNTTVDVLQKANKFGRGTGLKIGQTIVIP